MNCRMNKMLYIKKHFAKCIVLFYCKERKNEMKEWMKCTGMRAIKTVAQSAITMIGTSAVMDEVNVALREEGVN